MGKKADAFGMMHTQCTHLWRDRVREWVLMQMHTVSVCERVLSMKRFHYAIAYFRNCEPFTFCISFIVCSFMHHIHTTRSDARYCWPHSTHWLYCAPRISSQATPFIHELTKSSEMQFKCTAIQNLIHSWLLYSNLVNRSRLYSSMQRCTWHTQIVSFHMMVSLSGLPSPAHYSLIR